jgi:hypothetical protein
VAVNSSVSHCLNSVKSSSWFRAYWALMNSVSRRCWRSWISELLVFSMRAFRGWRGTGLISFMPMLMFYNSLELLDIERSVTTLFCLDLSRCWKATRFDYPIIFR